MTRLPFLFRVVGRCDVRNCSFCYLIERSCSESNIAADYMAFVSKTIGTLNRLAWVRTLWTKRSGKNVVQFVPALYLLYFFGYVPCIAQMEDDGGAVYFP